MSGDIFGVTSGREHATGIKWVEARDATANHSIIHTTSYPAQMSIGPW